MQHAHLKHIEAVHDSHCRQDVSQQETDRRSCMDLMDKMYKHLNSGNTSEIKQRESHRATFSVLNFVLHNQTRLNNISVSRPQFMLSLLTVWKSTTDQISFTDACHRI